MQLIVAFIVHSNLSHAQDYESRRDYVVNLLARIGFKIHFKPHGAFFLFAELPENCPLSDVCLSSMLLGC